MNPRLRLVVIVASFCVLAAGLAFLLPQSPLSIWRKPSSNEAINNLGTPRDPKELHESWRATVQDTLQRYEGDKDANRAKSLLLAAKVSADDRQMHMDFVLAFEALAQNQADGQTKLAKARADFEARP